MGGGRKERGEVKSGKRRRHGGEKVKAACGRKADGGLAEGTGGRGRGKLSGMGWL